MLSRIERLADETFFYSGVHVCPYHYTQIWCTFIYPCKALGRNYQLAISAQIIPTRVSASPSHLVTWNQLFTEILYQTNFFSVWSWSCKSIIDHWDNLHDLLCLIMLGTLALISPGSGYRGNILKGACNTQKVAVICWLPHSGQGNQIPALLQDKSSTGSVTIRWIL